VKSLDGVISLLFKPNLQNKRITNNVNKQRNANKYLSTLLHFSEEELTSSSKSISIKLFSEVASGQGFSAFKNIFYNKRFLGPTSSHVWPGNT
jgi:hypothetical protein